MALAAMLFPQPWTPSSRMPLGGSSGLSPASGSNPTRRVAIHFLSFPRPPSWSSPSGAGMNSRSPPPSTRPFFVSRMRGRSATERALSSTIARARARSASNSVRPCRSVDDALGLGAAQRDADRRALPGQSAGRPSGAAPAARRGRAGRTRTGPAMSSSSGFDGIVGTDEDDRPSRAGELLGRLSEQPQRGRRLEVRHRVLEQPGPVPGVFAGSAAARRRGRSTSPRRWDGRARGRSPRSSSRTGSSVRSTPRAPGPRSAALRPSRRRRGGAASAAGGRGPWR